MPKQDPLIAQHLTRLADDLIRGTEIHGDAVKVESVDLVLLQCSTIFQDELRACGPHMGLVVLPANFFEPHPHEDSRPQFSGCPFFLGPRL